MTIFMFAKTAVFGGNDEGLLLEKNRFIANTTIDLSENYTKEYLLGSFS